MLLLAASCRFIVLLLIIFVTWVIRLRDIVLVLICWHAWVTLNNFGLVIWIANNYWSSLLLIISVRVIRCILLVLLLVEYLPYVLTWLVVAEARFTLFLIVFNSLNTIILIWRCAILIILTCAFFESLIVSLTLVMTMRYYWLLQSVSVRVVANLLLLLHHHQSLIRVGSWGIALSILNTERVCYIYSIVCLTRKLTRRLFWHTLAHQSLLLICKPRCIKFFLLADNMTSIFCAWMIGVTCWCTLMETIRLKHFLLR